MGRFLGVWIDGRWIDRGRMTGLGGDLWTCFLHVPVIAPFISDLRLWMCHELVSEKKVEWNVFNEFVYSWAKI